MDFCCDIDLKDVSIKISAKNVDDAISDISYMLDHVEWNGKKYDNNDNFIKLGDLNANSHMKLRIVLKDKSRYKLYAKIAGRTYE